VSLEQAAELNRVAAHRHRGVRAPIPVGIGFCLYLRRDCLNEVGEFDVGVFGRGYGEETDFCLRARTLGWSHLLAADVFVYHAGALSFGSARHALLQRSQRLLNLRHPGFDRYIRDFLRQDSLHPLRRALDEYRLQALGARIVLLVTVSLPGGIDRFVAERSAGIRERGMIPLVLRPSDGAPHCCRLLCDELDVPNLEYEVPQDLSAFSAVLRSLAIDEIEFEHFLGLDPRVIELIRSLGVPYDVVIHDYAWICPRVTLVDGKGRYCGEPAVEACETCVKTNGSELRERISVAALRQRSGIWLTGARKVSAPSLDAATRLRRYMNISIATQPHSDILTQAVAPMKPTSVGNVRVVVIGALGDHKGYRVLLECARNARARRLALEFVVVGYSQNDAPLLKTGKVFITGAYQAHELPYLLRRERPHLAFIASVWPETWCYAVDEAHAAGIPVVAFDIGGVAERLHNHNIGPLLPLGLRPGLINDTLIQLAQKSPLSPSRNMAIMPKREEKRMEPAAGLTSSSDALSASVQMLPLSAGLYLFSVRVAPSPSSASDGTLRLPAMHVGLGPGVRSDQVEFISGPTTGGSWLFAKEDCLVTKVNGAGAVLLLTSIRGPGGESLAIKVERLDGRVEAAPALAASAVEAEKPHQSNGHDKATKTKVAKHERPPNEPYILATQINAHIRSRGDMSFRDTPWAGRIGPGLWIESFSVTPLARFEARDVEYKGLTGSGFETPWLTDGTMCGTKGLSVPLVGFAVRLKSSPETAAFDCEYSGYFKSGAVVGPLRNGAPCRSTVANDPLEGLQIAIRKRASADLPMAQVSAAKPFKSEPAPARPAGPTFGRYREAGGPTAAPGSKTEPLTTTRQGAAGNQVKRRPTRRG
jgi:glycosyltransferase involved in cell wall biosynthesis